MRTTALLFAGSMLLATILPAQGQSQPRLRPPQPARGQKMDARSFRRLTVPGEEVAQNVKRLTKELRWHKSVGGAILDRLQHNSHKLKLKVESMRKAMGEIAESDHPE